MTVHSPRSQTRPGSPSPRWKTRARLAASKSGMMMSGARQIMTKRRTSAAASRSQYRPAANPSCGPSPSSRRSMASRRVAEAANARAMVRATPGCVSARMWLANLPPCRMDTTRSPLRSSSARSECDSNGRQQLRSGIASQGCLDDRANQLGVRTARLARGEGELRLDDQPGIGVGLEHVELSVGSEAQVDARVVAKLERAVCAERGLLGARGHLLVEAAGDGGAGRLVRFRIRLPLHLATAGARHPLRKPGEIELDQRPRDRRFVAEDADVELAALDVLLDEGGTAELVLDQPRPLQQLLPAVDDGAHVDAHRSAARARLDDHRERKLLTQLEIAALRHHERGSPDAVVADDLLGQRLVLPQMQSVRTRSGVAHLEQIEEGGDVDVLAVVAGVRLGQVENQVRRAARETEQAFLALQQVEEGLVPQLLERVEHLLAREFGHPLGLARRRPLRLVLLARRGRRTKRRGRGVAG